MKDKNHVTRIALILDSLFDACRDARADGLHVSLDVSHDKDEKLTEIFGEYDEGCPRVDADITRSWSA